MELVAMFEGQIDFGLDLNRLAAELEVFSSRWDFRRKARANGRAADDDSHASEGAARWLMTEAETDPGAARRILEYSRQLGLVDAQRPSRSAYDCIAVLGGARLSCKLRPELAADVIRSGVKTTLVALLGAARPIPDSERDATDTYAPGATDEFGLLLAGGEGPLGFSGHTYVEDQSDDLTNANLSWVSRRYKGSVGGHPVSVLALSAPSSDPGKRRANSADTLQFMIAQAGFAPSAAILLVTSQIYVPYVQLEAIRVVTMPHKILVETIGVPSVSMPQLQGLATPNNYLQEVRSTIQAAQRFCVLFPA